MLQAGSCVTDGAVAYWAETMSVLAGDCNIMGVGVLGATQITFSVK